MKFSVSPDVFEVLDTLYLGVVVAKGIDNSLPVPAISQLLQENIKLVEQQLDGVKVKETAEVLGYRQAFEKLGMNANKYMSSIEAILTRIGKKKGFPSINTIVDLGNSLSIKYRLPMGAHDLSTVDHSLQVRFAGQDDRFLPFGETEIEQADSNELVYVSGQDIRTRRWIWRQSDIGKITETTRDVLFPIDGFSDKNKDAVLAAREELSNYLKEIFNCEITVGIVDRDNPEFDFSL